MKEEKVTLTISGKEGKITHANMIVLAHRRDGKTIAKLDLTDHPDVASAFDTILEWMKWAPAD